jgi:hypothetical protein
MEQRPGYVGPLLLLAIGFTLLFNNLGLFPWEIWGRLLHYWPVILILSGIQIFARHSSRLMYFAAVFLSILLIIGAVFLAWNGFPRSAGMDLRGAILNNAGYNGYNFADLDNADLSNAVLDGANIKFINLEGANMTGARMEGVNHGFARTSGSTICPDSRNGPCW